MSQDKLNERLYKQMLQSINDYQSKNIDIKKLISELEGLHNLLENPSSAWTEIFYLHWMPLEEIYAVALDRQQKNLDEKIINEHIRELEKFVKLQMIDLNK